MYTNVADQYHQNAVANHIHVRERPLKRRLTLSAGVAKRARVDSEVDQLNNDVDDKMHISGNN